MFPNSSCMYCWISEDCHPKKWEQRDLLILTLYTVVHSKVSLPSATYRRLYPDVGDISEWKQKYEALDLVKPTIRPTSTAKFGRGGSHRLWQFNAMERSCHSCLCGMCNASGYWRVDILETAKRKAQVPICIEWKSLSRKPGHDIDPFVLYLAALGKRIKQEKGITMKPQIIISQAPNKRVRSNFTQHPWGQ